MSGSLAIAGLALAATLAVGVLVHEWLHVLVLRRGGVDCSLTFESTAEAASGLETLVSGSVAAVRLEAVPATCSDRILRAAALAPLVMLVPVAALALAAPGFDAPLTAAVVVGWMACALPSPADFAIAWHPADARRHLTDRAA